MILKLIDDFGIEWKNMADDRTHVQYQKSKNSDTFKMWYLDTNAGQLSRPKKKILFNGTANLNVIQVHVHFGISVV